MQKYQKRTSKSTYALTYNKIKA